MSIIDLGVLKERNSLLLFFSQSVSAICDKLMSIGLIWYLTKNFSIEIIPWFLAISFLPHLLFSFFSAKIINRFSALKIVVFSEFSRGLLLLCLYFIMASFSLSSSLFLFFLFLTMFLVGIGSSLFNPAILSLPPLVTRNENVMKLNALIDSSFSISTIIGAVCAVFLLQHFALKDVVLINALSFVWAGILQLGVKSLSGSMSENATDQPLGPYEVMKKFPTIARMLLLFFLLNLFLNPIFVLIPWYVDKVYSGDSSSLAFIEGAMGVGAFLTGLIVSLLQIDVKDNQRVKMISLISILFGVFFVLFSFSKFTWHGALVIFLIGALSTFLNIQVLTYFQTAVKQVYVPSLMTAVNLISVASLPLSFAFTGFIFPHIDVPYFVKVIGMMVILIGFLSVFFLEVPNENQQ